MDSINEFVISNVIMIREEALERLSLIGRSLEMVEFSEHKMGVDDSNPIIQAVWKFKDSALQDSKSLAVISELTASKDGIHDACLYCSIRCSTV